MNCAADSARYPAASEAVIAAIKCVRKWRECIVRSPIPAIAGFTRSRPGSSSVVEDLKVANMIRHPTLARSIADASWSRFVSMLDYKAEKAGGNLIRVDPRNTSQECSRCHNLVPKSLAVRTHKCPFCGLVIHRDYNGSLNIRRAGIGAGALNVIGLR